MPETAARVDPVVTFRFEVKLDGLSVGGFNECTGLQVETEVHDYAEGGLNTNLHRFPTRTKHGSITLRRGVVDRGLWNWYDDVVQGRISRKNGTISVRDAAGENVVLEWQFRDAFPCRWSGPDMNAAQSNVAVETLELCHQGLERRN
jgi:phage tail-like protein